jgi:NADP-dependent 3-hydroxy acid dehydrogenase YdfG
MKYAVRAIAESMRKEVSGSNVHMIVIAKTKQED